LRQREEGAQADRTSKQRRGEEGRSGAWPFEQDDGGNGTTEWERGARCN
jgi:hypothetical protein